MPSDGSPLFRSAIITDSLGVARSIEAAAGGSWSVTKVCSPAERDRVLVGSPDVIVIDVDRGALELLHHCAELAPSTPVIVLTPPGAPRERRALMEAGAADVICRSHSQSGCLGERMEHAMVRHKVLLSLREQAMVDPLTGLLNRRGFAATGERHESLARRRHESFSIMVADIDGLKQINDTLGHAAGDQALIEASNVFRATCRSSDAVARLGGDEFAVLAIGAVAGDAQRMVERLRAALDARNRRGDLPFRLGMSFGMAWFDPAAPRTMRGLLSEADASMYVEKRHARRAGLSLVPAGTAGTWCGGPEHRP